MSNMSVELYNKIREDALATDITLCGRQYTTRNVYPVEEPTTRFIMLDTLTGLVNYLKTWEREAMKNIKDFLEFELPELHVIA